MPRVFFLKLLFLFQFFAPLNPLRIHIDVASNGKSTGEADVEFRSHEDSVAAMSKDKNHMRTLLFFLLESFFMSCNFDHADVKLI